MDCSTKFVSFCSLGARVLQPTNIGKEFYLNYFKENDKIHELVFLLELLNFLQRMVLYEMFKL